MNFQELIDQLLANSWRAGILIAALFAFRGVLRRFLDARVIYLFWVLVALRLLLPFDVPVSVTAARYLPPAPWTSAMDFDTVPFVSASAPVVPGSVAPPAAASLREILLNEKTLAIVWAAGVATVLLAYFWASLSFRRQLSRSGRRAGKRTEQAVSSCSRAMGLNPIPVLEMEALSGPALFGVWRPRLLFPLGLADQLSDEELRLVVLHELGHLKRRDLFLQGLLVVSQAVHWFNPLVWLAGRLAREDRELACDEFVMAHTSNSGAHAYAKTLLRVLGLSRPGRSMLPAVGILETKNQIKQRIIMITKYQSTNARRLVLGAASILAVSAGLLMVNAAESGSNASTPAAAAATETETATPAMPNKISITPKNKNTFKNGDGIEIKEVLGSVPNFQVGGTYRVKGVCRQQTLDSAQLYMGNTILERTGEGDFGQNAIIPVGATWLFKSLSKGSTEFEYVFKLLRPGTLHITIYDGGSNAYAGIYLGETFDSNAAKAPGSNNGRNPKAAIGDPKAGKIIIPKINFTDVSVEKALEFLRAKSRELDPEKKGVEIILKDSQKSKDTAITLTMVGMPLFEAVKYVGEAANLDVNWVGKAIVLTSRADVESSKGSTPDDRKTQASNPDVLARVNNVAITIDQLNLVAGKRENEIRQKFTGEERERQIAEARKQALNDLIDRELILQEFEQRGLFIDQKIFDDRISEIAKKEFGGDKAALRAAVEKQGFSWEQFMKWEREKIIIVAMRESNTRGESEMKAREAKEEKWLQSLRDKASIQLLAER